MTDPVGSAAELGRRVLTDIERHTAGAPGSDDLCLVCVRRADGGPA